MKRIRPEMTKLTACLCLASLLLTSCLSAMPLATPTPTPPTPTLTPTFTFPTLVPSRTFTPQPSPSSTPDLLAGLGLVLFQDTFDQNRGWDLGQSDDGGASLVNGRLSLAVRQSNTFYFLRSPSSPMIDFFLELSMRSELCTDGDEFGVMYRVNALSEHYRFALTCDGKARVSRVLEEGEVALVPVTQTYAVLSGLMVDNRIGLWVYENNFRFYINGIEVFSARDSFLPSGDLGLFVRSRRGGQTTASFDNLIARELLPPPTPTATPTPSQP